MSGLSESEKAKMNALAGKIVPALAAVTAGASALAVLGNLLWFQIMRKLLRQEML